MSVVVQEINLYQPVSKGVRGALSAGSARTTLILVSLTLLGLWGFATWQVDNLRDATQVVRNQIQAQEALSAVQGPQLQALSDEEIEALLGRLDAQAAAKSRALAMLSNESAANAPSFSARLRAFGLRHIEGIWLDRLTFGASVESVSISGSTRSPESVPRYLRSLAADPALQGGQIDEFIIEKPAAKPQAASGQLTFKAGRRGLVQRAEPT